VIRNCRKDLEVEAEFAEHGANPMLLGLSLVTPDESKDRGVKVSEFLLR
jgi:hypothetical protein